MGARYVWNRYTKYQKYVQRNTSVSQVDVGSNYAYAAGSMSFNDQTGMFTLSNLAEVSASTSQEADERKYLVELSSRPGSSVTVDSCFYNYGSGAYWWNSQASFAWDATGVVKLTASSQGSGGQSYYFYKKTAAIAYYAGNLVGSLSNASSGAYPYDGASGNYYYIRQGSDEVDPTAVTVPDDIDDGTTIQISLTPNSGKSYGGTISYSYQYRYDGGSWQDLATTTATTVSLAVPKDQYSTLEVRARAQDDMGFTSTDWISSGAKAIIANQPPTAPGLSVENVYSKQHAAVTLTPATDPDGSVTGYILQRSIDGGAWAEVQSGTSMSYSEAVSPDWGTVAYRAAAVDNEGLQGPWSTSQTFDVNPGWVIISGPESELGDRRRPFHFRFSVGVAGSPDEDDIVTRVMLDGRYTVVEQTFHDADVIDIRLDVKYFAQGPHEVQITADKEDYTGAMSTYTFNVTNDGAEQLLAGASAEVAQNEEAKPIVFHGLARFIYGPDGRDVVQMCGDGLKLASGSYTGTGTSGSGSPNIIPTGFKAKVAVIAAADGSAVIRLAAPAEGGTVTAGGVTATFGESSLSWYAGSAAAQLNASDTSYIYEIIG